MSASGLCLVEEGERGWSGKVVVLEGRARVCGAGAKRGCGGTIEGGGAPRPTERRRRFARLVRRPPRIILLRAAAANSQQLVHPSLPIRQRCDPHTHTRILAIISAGVQECEREFSGAQLWRPPRANTAQFNTSTFAHLGNSQLPKRRLGERVSSSPPTRRVRVRFPGAISRINDAE